MGRDVEVADQNVVILAARMQRLAGFHFIEKAKLVLEFRIERRIRNVAARWNVEVMQFDSARQELISRSMNLQSRVRRLDVTIHAPATERAPIGNPLVPQLNRLKAAFEQ